MVYAPILKSLLKAKACDGKVKHKNRRVAEAAMNAFIKRKLNGERGDLEVYKCKFCSDWHFGNSPKLRAELPPEIPHADV